MDWSKVKFFTKAERHFLYRDMTGTSSYQVISNNGQTIVLFADKRTVVASNFGSDKELLQYDLRPSPSYTLKNNVLWPHPRGKFKVIGYYPNYYVQSTGDRVYIGPKLNFYYEPQRPVDQLANDGLLLVDQRRAKLCLNCENLIPVTAGPNAKYCCYDCGLRTAADKFSDSQKRAEYRELKNKLKDLTKKPPRQCLTCDGPIDFKVSGPTGKYCCYECGLRTAEDIANGDTLVRTQKPKRDVTCYHCTRPFQTGRQGARFFCSPRCRAGIGPRVPE